MNFSGHRIPYFLTYKQVKELGGVLKLGAKAEKVIYFNMVYKDLEGHRLSEIEANEMIKNKMKVEVSRLIKYYPVFNIEDSEGISVEMQDLELSPNEKSKPAKISSRTCLTDRRLNLSTLTMLITYLLRTILICLRWSNSNQVSHIMLAYFMS